MKSPIAAALALLALSTLSAATPDVAAANGVVRVRAHRLAQHKRSAAKRMSASEYEANESDLAKRHMMHNRHNGDKHRNHKQQKSQSAKTGSKGQSSAAKATQSTNDAAKQQQNGNQNESGKKDGNGQNGGQKNEGGQKATKTSAAAAATKTLPPGQASLAAALAVQKSGQDAGFASSSSALKAKFTAATDNNFGGKGSNKVSQDSLTLDKSQVAIGSFSKGNPAAGQANSATSKNNFINFCATKQVPLMNGLQQRQLSCNPIPMGMVVPIQNAPTVKWKNPTNNAVVKANQNLTLELNVKNIVTGVFTDAQGTYFAAPQDVDKSGKIIGHGHFVVNQINGLSDTQPAPADKFVLFKGIDTAAVNGVLSFVAINGFPPGTYQACSMMSSSNHQPVLVSLAQRKNQDDCVVFTAK